MLLILLTLRKKWSHFNPKADINGDGELNFQDVQPFITLILGG